MALNPFEQLRNVCVEPRQAFEDVAADILRVTMPTSRRVRVFRGDGGVDVYNGTFGNQGEVDVFQIKYFPEPWGDSQKEQIRNSFRTAKESKDYNLRSWTLCVPVRLTKEDIRWFDFWRSSQSVPIEIMDGDDLATELQKPKCLSVVQKLIDFGVQGLRPGGPRFTVHGKVYAADMRTGLTFAVDLVLENEGDRTARGVHVVVSHSETECVSVQHDDSVWDEVASGRLRPLNPRRLSLRQDLNPKQNRLILEIPLCERTRFPFRISVQISAEDQLPSTVSTIITTAEAGATLMFTSES